MGVSDIMIYCYDEPEMVETVMNKVTEFSIAYCRAYKEAGANGVMIAEPLTGLLSPALAEEFSHPYVKRLIDAVQADDFAVIYHNCGDNTPRMTDSFLSMGAAAYHFGNSIDMKAMLEKFPKDIPVMGNVDPAGALRLGTPELVREKSLALLDACAGYENFVVSSGCDIPPMSPWENLDAFFAAVEEYHAR